MIFKVFWKHSNLCDNDTSTSQADGRTTCHGNTAMASTIPS